MIWLRIEGARGIWANSTTGQGNNIKLVGELNKSGGGTIQVAGEQYRGRGNKKISWGIN